jgi:hypothetical protein
MPGLSAPCYRRRPSLPRYDASVRQTDASRPSPPLISASRTRFHCGYLSESLVRSPNGLLFVTIRDFFEVADLTPGDAVRQRFGHRPAPTYLNFAGRPLDVLDNREKIRETGVSLVQWMFE